MKAFIGLLLSFWLIAAINVVISAQATTPVETDPLDLNPATGCMEVHFSAEQPETEREVPASAILESLRSGNCIRLSYAIIQGDLDLKSLPVNGVDSYGEELIAINGPFVIRNSQLLGELLAAKIPGEPRVWFEGPVVFTGSTLGNVDLTDAEFVQEVHFDETRFAENVKLDRVLFEASASFENAAFEKPLFLIGLRSKMNLDFSNVTFSSLVRAFGMEAHRIDLSDAVFQTTTDFARLNAGQLEAERVQFDQTVDFKDGHWSGQVNFRQAKFLGNSDFSGTSIEGMANFEGSQFEGSVSFSKARFFNATLFNDTAFGSIARFSETQFHATVDFSQATFQELNLENARFYGSTGPVWNGTAFNDEITLNGVFSASTWFISREQLQGYVDDVASHPFLSDDAFIKTLSLILIGITSAGVFALLYLTLN